MSHLIKTSIKPVTVITGAAGNLGAAFATAMAATGARLVLLDHNADALNAVCATLPAGCEATSFIVDLMTPAAIAQTIAAIKKRYDHIDILANIAGGFSMGPPVHETSDDDWERMMNLNARSVFYLCRAIVPTMIAQGGGSIINVAARAALMGQAQMAPYCASKSAVMSLTESLAAELSAHSIRVNCVLPGTLDTPQNRAAMPNADYQRWVTPASLAEVMVFLTSNAARDISGAAIPVYGRC
ncbi:SDR family oxidoreductase [Rhodopseudomonas palustris]|uniref:SDR family oxidoreductase n=1 Tax=Thiospirillum jenense TaxID=1653858 RepID=A0A839HBV9_9GAMM|nr:SDR family NAD(P)-dependent oxidoreductase [Thiospirillum jenense]MBB1089678.1 SDR family oxidoreductase [Rhodopseudomonas palustris]MBB1124778.1 SDR family oxidoreductase [Thiospirillum jenense]